MLEFFETKTETMRNNGVIAVSRELAREKDRFHRLR